MKGITDSHPLKINISDPRCSRIFLKISQIMNTSQIALSHEHDWGALDTHYQQHYRKYGYDLQSGCWSCLIGLKVRGWKGLAEALTLWVSVWRDPQGINCWPPAAETEMRRYLLDWFNKNIVTAIYTLHWDADCVPHTQRVVKHIGLLQTEAEKIGSRCGHSLKNVNYFLHVRGQSHAEKKDPFMLKPAPSSPPKMADKEEGGSEKIVMKALRHHRGMKCVVAGATGGVLVTLLILGGLTWWYKPALNDQLVGSLLQVSNSSHATEELWKTVSREKLNADKDNILNKSASALQWIISRPGDELLAQGNTLAHNLKEVWPNNPVSQKWEKSLAVKAALISPNNGFQQAYMELDRLDARLINSEKNKTNYLTISELKSISWKLRRELESSEPPTEFLRHREKLSEWNGNELNREKVTNYIKALNVLYLITQ